MNGDYNHFTPVEAVLLCVMILLLAAFNRPVRKMGTKKLVTAAILCALAGAGGAALRTIPGVQPTSFVTIFCGLIFGPGPALCCGIVTALLFDVLSFITQYTVWRMFLWGMMGFIAGFLPRKPAVLIPYGFLWGFIFGWASNMVMFTNGTLPFSFEAMLASFASSFVFDLSHAVTNTVLLLFLTRPLLGLSEKSGIRRPDPDKFI